MKKLVIVLGLAVTGLTACNNFKKGEGDMMYKIHTDKSGETIRRFSFIQFL
jgi:FKBP-type peptidyl-prolyl cis-trans isomerase FkpA